MEKLDNRKLRLLLETILFLCDASEINSIFLIDSMLKLGK